VAERARWAHLPLQIGLWNIQLLAVVFGFYWRLNVIGLIRGVGIDARESGEFFCPTHSPWAQAGSVIIVGWQEPRAEEKNGLVEQSYARAKSN